MSGHPSAPLQRAQALRRRRLVRRLKLSAWSALLVSDPLDVSYLSGFSGEDSYLMVGAGWASLLTDGRFDEQARIECPGLEILVRKGPMTDAMADVSRRHGLRRIGYQPSNLTVSAMRRMEQRLGVRRLRPMEDGLLEQRAVKDAVEVRAIRRSAGVTQAAFRELAGRGAGWFIGRTERAVAAELDYLMQLGGAEGSSFPTIVAAGPHASLPHYRPGPTRIRAGQGLLIDWGARKDGYCSDLTRVLFLRTIPPKLARIYDVVLEAQRAGLAAVRSGATVRSVDAAARSVIERAGLGERFTHGLGHGIGRAIHELPAISSRIDQVLRPGMVVTVEPGVYLPGVGGVRIEDDVLVSPGRSGRLTSLPTAIRDMLLR